MEVTARRDYGTSAWAARGLVSDVLRLVRNTSEEHGHFAEYPSKLRARIAEAGGLAGIVLERFDGLVIAAARVEGYLDGVR